MDVPKLSRNKPQVRKHIKKKPAVDTNSLGKSLESVNTPKPTTPATSTVYNRNPQKSGGAPIEKIWQWRKNYQS